MLVTVSVHGWNNDKYHNYDYYEVEVKLDDSNDTTIVAWELYEDRNTRWLIAPDVPYIGAYISICGTRFKIIGYEPRYSVQQEKWTNDIKIQLV